MGIYQYTCRAGSVDIDGLKIGRFSFAYKHSRYDGWEPDARDSNKYVRMFESKARKARESSDTDLYITISGNLTKKNIWWWSSRGFNKIPVYKLCKQCYQYTEELIQAPVGYIYFDAEQKMRFAKNTDLSKEAA